MDLKHRKKIKHFDTGKSPYSTEYYNTRYGPGNSILGVGNISYNRSASIMDSKQFQNQVNPAINMPSTVNVDIPANKQNSTGLDWGKGGNIATSLVNHVGAVHNAFTLDRSEGEIEAAAGSRNINAGGWAWQKQNDINRSKELSELNKQNTSNTLATAGSGAALGAAIGSIFPGAGTIIGGAIGAVAGLGFGLFGGSNRKRKLQRRIYNAQQSVNRNNNYAFAAAQGDYLNQMYDLNHEYTQDDQIYVANEGKDQGGYMKKKLPHYDVGKVATPYGWKKGPATSIIGEGETAADLNNGFAFVPHMKGGKSGINENVPSGIQEGDANTVFSTKYGYADYVRPVAESLHEKNKPVIKQQSLTNRYGDLLGTLGKRTAELNLSEMKKGAKDELAFLNNAAEMQKNDPRRIANNDLHYDDGKNELGIPGWARAIPPVAGLLAGWNQLNWWKRQPINTPDIYAANPNEGRALSTLASIHDNPYGALRQMQDVERRAVANTNGMGGLSGSQRYLSNVASTLGLQRNYADILRASQAQNNQYRANYASSALQAGQADAARRMEANQFGYNAYTAAHGRKVKGIETGIANILNSMNNAFANEFKYRMGNKTLGMYQQSLDNEKAAIASKYGQPSVTINNNPYTLGPTWQDRAIQNLPTLAPVKLPINLPYSVLRNYYNSFGNIKTPNYRQ